MVEPRKAAACIILSDEPTPRVLLVRRNPKLRFMGGHHAFPGGRIDDEETANRVIGAPNEDEARAIHALVREVFEETGLLPTEGGRPDRGELARLRRAMLAEDLSFDEIIERFDVTIRADRFHPAGLWVTPKVSPIRFHTRYYLYQHQGERYEELIEGEIVGLDWLEPAHSRRLWREGSIQLPAPVAYALQQLADYDFPQVLEPLRRTTHLEPDQPGRIEYRCGVNALPLRTETLAPATHTNCIVVGDRELYVIDPGPSDPAEQKLLADQLDHMLSSGGRVAAILLTHGHRDHVGAVEFVRDRYDVPVWAHRVTGERVAFKIDRALEEGEIITIAGEPDWRLRCLHTPGHDPGHLCYLEETTRTLLCGDMIAAKGTIVVSVEGGGDMTQYLNSLERLLGLDFEAMIPSHGMSIQDPRDKIREYISHRLMREEKVKGALARGLKTMDEMIPVVYDDVAPEAWPWARHSLQAHLARLGAEVAESS